MAPQLAEEVLASPARFANVVTAQSRSGQTALSSCRARQDVLRSDALRQAGLHRVKPPRPLPFIAGCYITPRGQACPCEADLQCVGTGVISVPIGEAGTNAPRSAAHVTLTRQCNPCIVNSVK